ncbi:hypothetical protein [Nannocystis sp.]|uniref:hypothetical protein n=1 Tax=Nannocystis sp. TaxID=1962667 RepID=UPI0025DB4956|nr:hypothetical protein [Nannocystis sp.]MBK7827981.1 hypothetical protein [Nannocystis sp.]
MAIPATTSQRILSALLLACASACAASPSEPTTSAASTSTASTDAASSASELPTTTATATGTSDTTTAPSTGSVQADTGSTASTVDASTTGNNNSTTDNTDTTDTTTTGTTGTTGTTTSTGTTGDPEALGTLSGDCGLIDAMELESPAPFVFTNAIDLGVGGFDEALLTPGGMQMIAEGGLNDGSLKSEVIAYEVLARCDMATLLKTEAKIVYQDPMGKKTDILVELDGAKVGVSVVRAVGFPKQDPYTVAQATTILKKKLGDIQISSGNVAPEDAWVKQILHVVAYAPMHSESIVAAYADLDPLLKADTILVVSVTDGDDALLY